MSLMRAMTAFVRDNGDRAKMNVLAWAATYPPATPDDVRQAWEIVKGKASLKPSNAFDESGEGK